MEQKSIRGYSAIASQWICAVTIRRAIRENTREHLFGFRNTGFAASSAKQEVYTIAVLARNLAHDLRQEPPNYLFAARVMDRDKLRCLLGHVKRGLLRDRRSTREECYQLFELSEGIIEHGRMIQEHIGYTAPYAMVEVPELARRFRETPRTIQDALALLRAQDRAEPSDLRGRWKLSLAATFHSEEDKGDVGAA